MLLAVLREHGDVIEADFQQHYRVDLVDLWRGTLSLRRVRVLLDHLPPDCATAYALAGDELGHLRGWTLTQLLAGRLVDELTAYRWQWESAHIDPKKARPRKAPESVLPRPIEEPKVIPLVRPSQRGGFVNDTEEVTTHGD